jgi:hypothetical protein
MMFQFHIQLQDGREISHLSVRNSLDGIETVWQSLSKLRVPFPAVLSLSYFGEVIRAFRLDNTLPDTERFLENRPLPPNVKWISDEQG